MKVLPVILFLVVQSNLFTLIQSRVKFYEIMRDNMNRIISDIIVNETIITLNNTCRDAFKNSYLDKKNSDLYYYKLVKDSSKNKNDVGSYNDCLLNIYSKNHEYDILTNFTYLIIDLKTRAEVNKTDVRYGEGAFMFGICIVGKCSDEDYREILYEINERFGRPLDLKNKELMTVYNVKGYSDDMLNKSVWKKLFMLIPFFLFVLQFILMCVPNIPEFIFRPCFKKDASTLTEESSQSSTVIITRKSRRLDKNLLFKFKSAFSISDNGEELFCASQTEMNNDTGLAYIKGMRGLNMLLLIIGIGFYILYNSNLKVYESVSFTNFLSNPCFSYVFFGLRYSPKILLSCSGFTFIYKFLSYLDEKKALVEGKAEIKYIYLIKFLTNQLYKYFIYGVMALFFKYSFFYIFLFVSDTGPMSVFFKLNVIDNVNSYYVFDIFWLALNEVYFFILSSLIVFISYKNNYRMDIFFVMIFFCIMVYRYVFFVINEDYYTTLFYYYDQYGYFFINPIYNYPFYIIGIFFGKINFTIQNSIRRKDAIQLNKNYLIFSTYMNKLFKSRTRLFYYTFIIIGLLIVLLTSFTVPLFIYINSSDNYLSDYFKNSFINLFFLIDTELVVTTLHLVSLCLFLMGQSYIMKFFSNSFWMMKSKIYFSFILVANPLILYIFYHSESRIKLDYVNITFFAIVNYVITLIMSGFIYVFVELPFKRVTKIILRVKTI